LLYHCRQSARDSHRGLHRSKHKWIIYTGLPEDARYSYTGIQESSMATPAAAAAAAGAGRTTECASAEHRQVEIKTPGAVYRQAINVRLYIDAPTAA